MGGICVHASNVQEFSSAEVMYTYIMYTLYTLHKRCICCNICTHYVDVLCNTAICAKKGCNRFVEVNCIPATSLLQPSRTAE